MTFIGITIQPSRYGGEVGDALTTWTASLEVNGEAHTDASADTPLLAVCLLAEVIGNELVKKESE